MHRLRAPRWLRQLTWMVLLAAALLPTLSRWLQVPSRTPAFLLALCSPVVQTQADARPPADHPGAPDSVAHLSPCALCTLPLDWALPAGAATWHVSALDLAPLPWPAMTTDTPRGRAVWRVARSRAPPVSTPTA